MITYLLTNLTLDFFYYILFVCVEDLELWGKKRRSTPHLSKFNTSHMWLMIDSPFGKANCFKL